MTVVKHMKIKYLIIFLFLLTNCSSDLEYLEKFKGYNSNPRTVETKTFILEKVDNIDKEIIHLKKSSSLIKKGEL